MLGQTLDHRYRIEAIIGRGGAGTVYRALDLEQGQPVALKLLNLGFGPRDQLPLRFYREFRVLARLHHPHIVRAYDHGQVEGMPYLVLELLEGQTLKEVLAEGPLARSLLLAIASQLCDALIHIHAQSIVHRDLKPGNVMLLPPAETPHVKLMDFGLVHLAQASLELTQDGSTLGTFAYMAPEQAQGLPTDFSADLYSLGIILYEMATGRPPFIADNPATLLLQQVNAPAPSPRHFNPDIDEPLARLILQLLQKERRQRAASTRLVGEQLAQLADDSQLKVAVLPSAADPPPQLPLIGREESLGLLLGRWQVVRQGQGQVVVLAGPLGIGKDRLLTEMIHNAGIKPDQVVQGRTLEHGALPYQPLVDLLEQIAHSLPAARRRTLPPQLGRLLPDLDELAEVQGSPDEAESRLQLFAACWHLLREWVEECPRLLIVDDLQWADSNSLELLAYFVRRLPQAPLFLSLTCRADELDDDAPLARLLRDWRALDHVQRLNLPLLDNSQVADYLRAWFGRSELPSWLVDSFHQATGGNPFFLEETLKVLAAEGEVERLLRSDGSQVAPATRARVTLQLPDSVLSIAERRLRTLSPGQRRLLTRAAVLGPEFSFDLLQGMTGKDEETLVDALDWLLAANILEELPLQDGEDRYAFRQESLRQALLQRASRRRLRLLHRQAGQALQTFYDTYHPRYWPLLAYHFALAGESVLALKYYTLAGDGAMRVYANGNAAGHYAAALEIAREHGAQRLQWHHLYTRRGRALELASRYDAALANYLEMEEQARAAADRELLLAALLARATILNTPTPVNDVEIGRQLAEEALALAQELGDRRAEASALWSLLINRSIGGAGRSAEAIRYGEASLAISRALNLRRQMAYTLNDLHLPYMGVGQWQRALEVIEEAQRLWRELGDLPMLTDSLTAAAGSHFILGNLEVARTMAEEAYAVSQRIDNLWGQAYSRWPVAYYWLEHGQWQRALSIIEESVALAREAGMIYGLITSLADLGWLYALLGNTDRALGWVREAEQVMRASNLTIQFYPDAIRARIHVLRDELDEAEKLLTPYEDAMQGTASWGDLWLMFAKIELALARKDASRSLALAGRLLAYMEKAGMRAFRPDGLHLQARALQLAGRHGEASAALAEASTAARTLGSRRSQFAILLTGYRLALAAGESEIAAARRAEANELLTYILEHLEDGALRSSLRARADVLSLSQA